MARRLFSSMAMTMQNAPSGSKALPAEALWLARAAERCERLAEIRHLLADLPHPLLQIAACSGFDPGHYTRRVIHEGPHATVLLLGWLPGQSSEPHDHGGSLCAFRVLRGVATESRFELNAAGHAVEVSCDTFLPGSVLGCDGSEIHAISNDPAAGDPLVTLHVYRPAPVMRTYALAGGVQ